jgi:hypothetical protein
MVKPYSTAKSRCLFFRILGSTVTCILLTFHVHCTLWYMYILRRRITYKCSVYVFTIAKEDSVVPQFLSSIAYIFVKAATFLYVK